jgi:hypothetical protein
MYVWVWVKFKSFKSGVIWNDVVQPNMEAFCFSHRRFLTDDASPRVQPRQASAPLWCTDVDLGNAQRYARFANGRPGNPKVARLWRWQWPKSLIFLVPSKRKRIEPTQCHLNSRNLPSPHRPTGEGDQVLFEKTTSWACKAVLLAHERLCSSRCRAQGGIHSTPPVRDFYRSLLLLHQRPHSTKRTIQFVLPKIVARADLQLGSMSVSVDRNMFMSFACDHIEYRNHHSCS